MRRQKTFGREIRYSENKKNKKLIKLDRKNVLVQLQLSYNLKQILI